MGGLKSRYHHLNPNAMAHSGKKYREVAAKVDPNKLYSLAEAVALAKETSPVKFDATVEVHFKTGIDPKKPEQALRGTLSLPHGSGKKVSIAAIVTDDQVKAAKAAGADEAGLEDLIETLGKGKVPYDVIIATPDTMKKLGKVAKILGQKGLMPNPKSGTVTTDIEKTIHELKAGRIEFRNDKEANVHVPVGKVSFSADALENNLKSLLKALREARPVGIKGNFLKTMSLATSMGPGIKVEMNEAMKGL